MFIDYLPLMLINMSAGLVTLAFYINSSLTSRQDKGWSCAFFVVGLVAFVCGLHMSFTWPLPGSYNVSFGELSVLLGVLFLAAFLSIALGWSLMPLGIYAFLAGFTAIVVGIRIINLGLTRQPLLSGIGFLATGLSGVMISPVIYFRSAKYLRLLVTLLLIAGALIWIYNGYRGYWDHLKGLSNWVPVTMR